MATRGCPLLLGTGRRDESGDFTNGAGLIIGEHLIQAHRLIGAGLQKLWPSSLMQTIQIDTRSTWRADLRSYCDKSGHTGSAELAKRLILSTCSNCRLLNGRIRFDPSVVRGLEYYTGPVFEVELTFATDGKGGSPRFGSVGGGGRYDGLVARFRGEPVPATGFSFGVSRLLAALEYLGEVDLKTEAGPVVVTVFDQARMADYRRWSPSCARRTSAPRFISAPGIRPQMKYADKRNAQYIVIQGSDEKAKGEVTIKDLIVGAELAKMEKGRDEYLQKQAEAQRAVPESDLVEAVRGAQAPRSQFPVTLEVLGRTSTATA